MRQTFDKLIRRQDLTRQETAAIFNFIMSGEASDAQIAGLLMGMATKGIALDELTGAAGVMRDKVLALPGGGNENEIVLDTCGTGGTPARACGLFNISTAAAILVAACGVKVAKHGNRAATSKCGSADVLEHLGVRLDHTPAELRQCLNEVGICFAFARNHHPAMKHVAPARSALGVPTIFNLLGPLTNPAGAKHQLLGVYAKPLTQLLAGVLRASGSVRAWVVYADHGMDELSTLGPTFVCELRDGELHEWTLDPTTLGLESANIEALQVQSVAESAAAICGIVDGERGPRRDIASLNAAAGLVIAGSAPDLPAGLKIVSDAIDRGAARATLDKLIAF
ncbi:MAG TPA: anthranilate phosphoribosyltransferase [Tepidisphaeraceae bacterium]|jgi:anthranilate phosphoribosyltransferase